MVSIQILPSFVSYSQFTVILTQFKGSQKRQDAHLHLKTPRIYICYLGSLHVQTREVTRADSRVSKKKQALYFYGTCF